MREWCPTDGLRLVARKENYSTPKVMSLRRLDLSAEDPWQEDNIEVSDATNLVPRMIGFYSLLS